MPEILIFPFSLITSVGDKILNTNWPIYLFVWEVPTFSLRMEKLSVIKPPLTGKSSNL